MKKIYNMLFSMKLTAFLFLLIAFASAAATFIENDFGTQGAKALIYNALWFEIVIALFAVNLTGNIFRFKMYKKENISLFAFHISILFIILGSALTRYAGYEGIMHIRNAEASNVITSSDTYVQAKVIQDGKTIERSQKVTFSAVTNNDYKMNIRTPKGDVIIKYADFFQNAAEIVKADENGIPYINLLVSTSGGAPEKIDLFYNQHVDIDGLAIYFGKQSVEHKMSLHIEYKDNKLTATAPFDIKWLSMQNKSSGSFKKNSESIMDERFLYTIGNINMVIKEFVPKAVKEIVGVKQKTGISALASSVTFNNETKKLEVFGRSGMLGVEKSAKFGDTVVELSYGAKNIQLPFSVKLPKGFLIKFVNPFLVTNSQYNKYPT